MRPVLVVVGAIVGLLGVVWALQGAGTLPGSFMSDDPTWLWIGIITVILGLTLVVFGVRLAGRGKETKPS